MLLDGRPALSCLTLAASKQGAQVMTIEGVATGGVRDKIQEGFHERLGSQCGFCTPGMIMAARALLNANAEPSLEEIKTGLANNLCRCTGYNTIIESVQFAIGKMKNSQ